MMNCPSVRFLTMAAVVGLASAAQAAPVVFFGENQTPSQAVSGAPVVARNNFLSNLTNNVTSQGFESYAVGQGAPLLLSFTGSGGPLTASLTGDGSVSNNTSAGRFNTTPGGSKWFDVSGDFAITFGGAGISAFGFYATDVGDFNGQITFDLTDTLNNVTRLTVNSQINGANGSLLFFGFIDSSTLYRSISFTNTAANTDYFGFDDLVIGDLGQLNIQPPAVPEPGTIALVGLSLLGIAWSRRKPIAVA